MPHEDVSLEDEGLIDVAQTCGPFGWGVIHHAAESFPCAPCAEEGASLMRAAHDLVNFRIGLPIMFPEDVDRWHAVMVEAHQQIAHELDWEKMEAAQDRPAAQIREEIASTREVLNSEPANTLVRLVKRSGKNKGEIVDFTKRQFRELLGKDPPPAIVKPDGKIPWELSLDVIASELGYSSDEALKNGIERAIKERRLIEKLERELALIPATVCSAIDPGEVPCLEWEGEFCRQKEITCDGTVITAIRSPIDWSIHITAEDEFPDQDSQIDVARRADDASKVLRELAANPGDRIAADLAQSDKAVCSVEEAERVERCVRELKADPGIDEPFGVCVESIGCRVA